MNAHLNYFLLALLIAGVLSMLSLAVLSADERRMPASAFSGREVPSPGDWIREEQIKVYPDKVVLDISNAVWVGFTDTNSMDPFLDENSHGLEVKPSSAEEIQAGDIISYRTPYGVFVHRVIDIGKDGNGVYYIVKGDNNATADPFNVRFTDIEGVLVAVVY